jgi:hypothetical protein
MNIIYSIFSNIKLYETYNIKKLNKLYSNIKLYET